MRFARFEQSLPAPGRDRTKRPYPLKKILVVDDEFLIRYSLSHMLQTASVEVSAVSTGAEALREISRLVYDVCCLDIHLPDTTGIIVMKRIKTISPHTRIIMMTGGAVSDSMLSDIHENAQLVLSKPFDLFKVKTFIDLLLELSDPAKSELEELPEEERSDEYAGHADKRRHERFSAVARVSWEAVFVGSRRDYAADVVNISQEGMCLITNCPLTAGSLVRIVGPEESDKAAVVRWSMTTAADNVFRSGVQFSQEREASRAGSTH